jgi:hypothetical protein
MHMRPFNIVSYKAQQSAAAAPAVGYSSQWGEMQI